MSLRPHDKFRVLSILFLLALAGCSSTPLLTSSSEKSQAAGVKSKSSSYPALPPAGSGRGGYYKDDGPGDVIPNGLQDTPDATPRVEPYLARSNKPYVVFGKQYTPLVDNVPFKQRGYGSWYGKKFHGEKTSSGEIYDMYKMTAAHPTLPIPSYARVTNLSNGRQVIVRINDRGPFHPGRIIDLSYTAALKLGYIGNGSAQLEVERLLPEDIARINADKANMPPTLAAAEPAPAPVNAPAVETTALEQPQAQIATTNATETAVAPVGGFYLQFGAYAQEANAEAARARLEQSVGRVLPSLKVESSNNLYHLYGGPFASRSEAVTAAAQVQEAGASKPLVVQR